MTAPALVAPKALAVEGRINAAANALTLEWAKANLPPDAVERALARCRAAGVAPAELAGARGWASFASHVTLLQSLAPEMGPRRFQELGRANADRVERVLPGAGLLLKLASPKRLVSQAERIWSTYADVGRVRVDACDARAAALLIHGVDAPAAFWDTMTGFLARLLERAGAQAPVVLRADEPRGASFRGSWT